MFTTVCGVFSHPECPISTPSRGHQYVSLVHNFLFFLVDSDYLFARVFIDCPSVGSINQSFCWIKSFPDEVLLVVLMTRGLDIFKSGQSLNPSGISKDCPCTISADGSSFRGL